MTQEGESILNGDASNTWMPGLISEERVTDLQPLRHESDSFFDFDCEIESPGSPVDECEYLRLIESSSNTPHNSAAESGYACASAASSHSSTDGPYYDVNSDIETGHAAQTEQKSHICKSHQAKDEVDCVTVVVKLKSLNSPHTTTTIDNKTTNIGTSIGQCNGFGNHLSIESNSTTENGSQTKANDFTNILPIEGPDIESPEPCTSILKHNGIQEQILKELQVQSLEYEQKEEQWESENKLQNQSENNVQEMQHDCSATEQLSSKVMHTLINQPVEKGDDVLSKEITEVATTMVIEEGEQHHNNECLNPLEEAKKMENARTTAEKKNKLEVEQETKPKDQLQSHQSQQLNTASHMDTTDDEDDCRPQRVRRCSSLKTGKTPPGTPGRKKIVRFADVLGLDLADVKTFLDEIPTIPKSAYDDLQIVESESPIQMGPKSDKLLMPLFQQPAGLASFLDIVREKQVSLENAAVTDSINQTITGSVRVRNLDFHKSVHIRYSLDGWRSFADLQANYVENSCDGFSDKFTFVLFGNSLHIGQRLEFAVRFQCKGQQYWDNNYGANYCFQCLPSSTPAMHPISAVIPSHHTSNLGVVGLLSPTAGEAWCSSFY